MADSPTALSQGNGQVFARPVCLTEALAGAALRRLLLGSVFLVSVSWTPAFGAGTGTAHSAPRLKGTSNGRSQAYLGIEFRDLPPEGSTSTPHLIHGVEILKVDHDGPAGKAGLQSHDILVGLNGQAILNAEVLRRLIHDAGAGVQVNLNVIRGGRALLLNAQLATRDEVARSAMARLAASNPPSSPAPVLQPVPVLDEEDNSGNGETYPPESAATASPAAAGPIHSQSFIGSMLHSGPITGAVLDAMEPQLASFFGVSQDTGLLVHSVVPGSAAAQAGLRAGDVVLRADFVTLRSQADWTKHVHAAKGHPITLAVLRDRREMTLTLQPELKRHSMLEWPALF
ncbi:MAG: PDZ domain-containing protein [Janthinobacterium lividum]